MKKITEKTNISEAIKINPKAGKILMEEGIGCIGCIFAQSENLEIGLSAHGFSKKEIEKIIKKLNE